MNEQINLEDDALAVKLSALVDQSEKDWEKHWKSVEKAREYASGRVGNTDNSEDKLVRANLIYATIHAMMPYIYAKNPEVAVTPEESVEEKRYTWVRPFSKTLELVVNRQLRDAGLKPMGKKQVRGALSSRIGWTKLTYQRDYEKDPHVLSRIEDAQDNISRLQSYVKDLEEGDCADEEAKIEELQQLVTGLQDQVEVISAEGLVVDFIQATNIILDSTIEDFEQYHKGRFIAQRIWMTEDEAKERLEGGFEGARLYAPGDVKIGYDAYSDTPNKEAKTSMLCVYEIWHKKSQTVYTIAKGMKQWARKPFQPKRVGQRWYPFFGLAFYPLDGDREPLSLVELLRELNDEYNSIRTQLAEHREMSIPHWLCDKTIDQDSIERKRDAVIGELVILDANGRPLREVFQAAEPPPYNPAIYDTTPIRTDVEMMSGLQDAARGTVMRSKTATEAEFLNEGMVSRSEAMKDSIEDLYTELASYAAEILLQELTPVQVLRIAGPGATWPNLKKEEIFDLVEIQIRTGSTGKPNRRLEQETWIKVKPEIEKSIMTIIEMRATGQDPTPVINLLRETLRRFDERLDVENFLPQQVSPMMPPQGNVVPFPQPQTG